MCPDYCFMKTKNLSKKGFHAQRKPHIFLMYMHIIYYLLYFWLYVKLIKQLTNECALSMPKKYSKREEGLSRWQSGQESTCQCRGYKRHEFNPTAQEDSREEEVVIHSSSLAWEIQWTVEPGRLYSS